MMSISLEQAILDKKRHKEEEYFVNLFEHCNLRCSFCWQDHNSLRGIDTIEYRASDVSRLIQKSPRSNHIVNIMGGELFSDAIPESAFWKYYRFVCVIQSNCGDENKIQFNFVTNLVFDQTTRLEKLLNDCQKVAEVHLSTSWDPVGRFNLTNLSTFIRNYQIFKKDIRMTSVVLTKQCIRWFLSGQDKVDGVFTNLIASNPLYFDTYSPESNTDKFAPSDSEMLSMYRLLIREYPESYPVKDWIRNQTTTMSCRSSHIIGPQGYSGKCGSLVPDSVKNDMAVPINVIDNSKMEDNFIKENECLTCEFFENCGLGCFLLHNLKGRADTEECIFKSVNREIQGGL